MGAWGWPTPGGGLQAGETFEQAGAREAAEELGFAGVVLTPAWRLTAEFTMRGVTVRPVGRYFLARASSHGGWWPLGEIPGANEPVYPQDLPDRVLALHP